MLDLGSAVGYLLLDTKGFSSGFTSALQAVKTMQSQSATAGDKFAAMGSAMTSVGSQLTTGVTVPLIGLGAASVTTASKFESSMSQVQATMGITSDAMSELDGQSVNTMQALSSLAQEMGANTKFSASEAAAAINNMAMAGYDVQEIYQALPQVLSLASAGALDLDYATQLVANGLNVMGMETGNAQELADKLAVTASNAYGSVSDFGEGLLIAGAQAKLANVSLTDTMTALGILGDNGISASEGGTYLRNTLKNLYTPTEDAAKALTELGVQTANSDGTLRDFQTVLQDLGTALDDLTPDQRIKAMSRIFDTRTISAANALIANSTSRWDELSGAIDSAAGSADQMATTQLNNLQGQLTILKSSIEGAAISFGNMLLPTIKKLAGAFQNLMNWMNGLSDSQKKTVVTILEIVAAIGPMLLIFGKLSTAISSIIGLFAGAGGLSAALTVLTGPIGLVIAAVAALAAAWATDFGGIREVTAEIVGMVTELVQTFLNDLKTVWEQDLLGIRTTIETFWAAVESIFSSVLNVLRDIVRVFSSAIKGDWSATWSAVKSLGESIWNLMVSAFRGILNVIVAALRGIGSSLYAAATFAWGKIQEGATIAWEAVTSWFNSAVEQAVEIVTSVGSALYEAGSNIINSLLDGLKAAWEAVSGWLSSKADWIKGVFSGIGSIGVSGSHASGLDYVTHDSIVKVHEGEGILTKEQNREYRNNNGNSKGGDTFNFYSPKALNPTEAAREMKKAKQQLALGVL